MGAAGEVKRSPVIAAERDVGGRRLPVHDAAELLALQVEDPDAARAAAIDVAGRIDLHAVGDAGLAAAQIGERAVALLGKNAARHYVEGADVAAPGVVDVEHALAGRERKPVGQHEIVDEERERAEIRGEPVDAGKGQVPLLLRCLQGPWIGEIDRTVGFHHHIVWAVEPPPLKAVRQNRETGSSTEMILSNSGASRSMRGCICGCAWARAPRAPPAAKPATALAICSARRRVILLWSCMAIPPSQLRVVVRMKRPSRAAEQRDELAPLHSITSSARASRVVGTS